MKTYLELHDIESMEKQAGCLRDRLLIRVLFHLGCRVSEALAIKMDDIDFEQKTITILHLKTLSRLQCPHCKSRLAKRHRFCPECGKDATDVTLRQQTSRRQRVLPIDQNTLDLLTEYLHNNPRTKDNSSSPIFFINRHRAWQVVRDCATKAGIPSLINPDTGRTQGISPHRLRDAFSVPRNETG